MRTHHHISTKLLLLLFILIGKVDYAQKKVYQFDIHQEIGPAMTRLTEKAIAEAEKEKVDFILIDMDTYGGLVSDADAIRTALLRTKIPTIVYIKNNAASAGALISIACDSIFMASGSTIGAASVVNEQGELMPEKYQSYMRKKIRATAEETGRNPLIAEGMVDENMEVDSIKAKGKIITFSTDEAVKYGYCNAKVENLQDILKRLPNGPYLVQKHNISWLEMLLLWLIAPSVSAVLMLGIFAGIYFEFKAPGTLLPIAFSLVCAALYFAPHYMDGLAENWEIIIFFFGVVLLLLEIFVIPGFGIAGILGIVFTVGGLTLAMVRNIAFDFTFVPKGAVSISLLIVSVAMFLPLGLVLAFGKNLFDSPLLRKMTVAPEMKSSKGFSVKESKLDLLVGTNGVALTDLRPVGKISIDDSPYEASTEGAFIASGSSIVVIAVKGNYLVVRKPH